MHSLRDVEEYAKSKSATVTPGKFKKEKSFKIKDESTHHMYGMRFLQMILTASLYYMKELDMENSILEAPEMSNDVRRFVQDVLECAVEIDNFVHLDTGYNAHLIPNFLLTMAAEKQSIGNGSSQIICTSLLCMSFRSQTTEWFNITITGDTCFARSFSDSIWMFPSSITFHM